ADIDPRSEPMPVATAAHYHMGGIVSDIWGKSTLNGLSVCGECASTGAHGANRLASNSLLESVVFAERISRHLQSIETHPQRASSASIAPTLPDDDIQTLRVKMATQCGVIRSKSGLEDLLNWIDDKQIEIGCAKPLLSAKLIAAAALERKESRGGHHRTDYQDAIDPKRSYVSYVDGELTIERGPI
ncbi:MAG: FAD-binding protein, partial [Pseudomonadota bacterium]